MKRVLMSVFAVVVLASPAAAQEDLLSSCGDLTVQYSPAAPPFGQAEIQSQLQFLCGQVVNALTNVQPTIGIGFTGGRGGYYSTYERTYGFMTQINTPNGQLPAGPFIGSGPSGGGLEGAIRGEFPF